MRQPKYVLLHKFNFQFSYIALNDNEYIFHSWFWILEATLQRARNPTGRDLGRLCNWRNRQKRCLFLPSAISVCSSLFKAKNSATLAVLGRRWALYSTSCSSWSGASRYQHHYELIVFKPLQSWKHLLVKRWRRCWK